MSALAEPGICCRRPPGPAQCAGAGGRAGAGRRQQHRHRWRPGASSGAMLAPDKGLCDPADQHLRARAVDRHAADRRTGAALGPAQCAAGRHRLRCAVAGLICCLAVLQGSFLLFNIGAIFSGFYAAAHKAYRFAAADTASDAFRPKAISWVLFGGVLAGVVGPQLVIVTKDLWPPYLFAATFLGQSLLALVCRRRADARQHSAAAAARGRRQRPPAERDRARAALHRRGRLRGGQLCDDEHGDDLGAARHGRVQPLGHRGDARPAMARARHVRAELRHRRADRPLRRRAHRRARAWSS